MSQPSPSFHPEDKSNSENKTNSENDSPSELDQRYIEKKKDEKPIESKEAKKVKLISVENLKEKDTIKILSEDHYEVQQFLENIPTNTLKDGLTAVLPPGSLDIKPTFYIVEQHFIETEKSRFLDNSYILWQLSAEDNSNNNTTIGINLLYKEKAANNKNLKEDILAIAWLIYHLRTNLQEYYDNYLEKGMEFDGSKIKGAIFLTKNINDDHNSRINFPDKVDNSNMSLLIENMLTILDEIKSEDETSELSRKRNIKRYLYFHELYKKTLKAVAFKPKSFSETNASKVKDILENFLKKAEKKLTQRQWRSYRTSVERINKLWNICNKSFVIFNLVTSLTSNLF
ncbi:hypothetical protein RclHR1_38950001, partial [Rhizophagus clarus]